MSAPQALNAAGTVPSKRLFLVFYIGDERYALPATDVVEVLPRLPLKPIAQAPAWVAGVFSHRGQMVPVIDISAMTFGNTAVERTSTRLVLVNYRGRLLGLMLEQATDTLRCSADDFQPYGLDNRDAPYLGPVRKDERGLVQWITISDLLTPSVCALIFPPDTDADQGQVFA
ncbi:chemotaxis protein CheW [Pseudomonas sp.]|uniref:chemotaxis protein CheW n=1 Tax=Pseudomonas sp. TaxID=306 RepID=UPI0026251788|nr:chemotaxis protein CheW [Pseudomonas sp.]